MAMYILKIKGRAKIPDYIQIRDEDYTLLAYFRVDRPEKALIKIGLDKQEDKMKKIIADIALWKSSKIRYLS